VHSPPPISVANAHFHCMKVYVHPKTSVSATKNKYFFMPVTALFELSAAFEHVK